jgi:uncharacterized membrane protein YhaH (DUF805 family)
MSLIEAVKSCFKKYIIFSGRARRSEYWYFILFIMLIKAICTLLEYKSSSPSTVRSNEVTFFNVLYLVFLMLPHISVSVRRLHDIGLSGWCFFLLFIPIVNLILPCEDSEPGDNKYGPNPKGGKAINSDKLQNVESCDNGDGSDPIDQ